MAVLDIIAAVLQFLLMAVNRGRGKETVEIRRERQPMSDERFNKLLEYGMYCVVLVFVGLMLFGYFWLLSH